MQILIAVLGVASAVIGLVSVLVGRHKLHEVKVHSDSGFSSRVLEGKPVHEVLSTLIAEEIHGSTIQKRQYIFIFTAYCVVVGMLSGALLLGCAGGLVGWLGFSNVVATVFGILFGGVVGFIAGSIEEQRNYSGDDRDIMWAFICAIGGGAACLALFKSGYLGEGKLPDITPGDGAFWGCLAGSVLGFLGSLGVGYIVVLRKLHSKD